MSDAVHVQSAKPAAAARAGAGRVLQRKCACGRETGPSGECAACRRKRLQRKGNGAGDATNDALGVTPAVQHVLQAPGRSLDRTTREAMEHHFGHDFSQVQVHTGAQAAASARRVNALAYTVGQHVVFGARQFDPHTREGRRLLAHELAHVVQQRDARCSAGDLAMAGDRWEREADAAAQAVAGGGQATVRQQSAQAMIARFVDSRTTTEPDGSTVEVERVVTAGRCRQVPETRSDTSGDITAQQAFLEINACRGRVSGGARGEINYGDAINDAAAAAARLLTNLGSGQQPDQAVRSFESDLRGLTPNARLRFNLGVPGFRANLEGTGQASMAGGASGQAQLRLEFDVGPVTVGAQGSVSGGTQDQPGGAVTVTVEPRRREPTSQCFVCACSAPRIEFRCTRRTPSRPTTPPARPQPVIVPLFFEYADVTPRPGWEQRYQEMLRLAVTRIRAGYTIDHIEGFTSPEGLTQRRPGGRFEGNIRLAERRAVEAQADLQQALRADLSGLLVMRGGEHVRAALGATYPVVGRGELFGATATGEVANRQLFSHLQSTLGAPQPGQPDPLAEQNVTGEAIPASVRDESEAQVAEFRTGRRGAQRLTQTQRLEAIYQPLRRALIYLNPPPPPPPDLRLSPETLRAVVGEPITCTVAHRALFAGVTIPPGQLFEGECSEPGERPDRSRRPGP
ncbi:MAG TPA: DUF4157 domain-containing protein [Caldilinea sp.]|nr:DUF4157 domain-containing protein [Caldilinea sp.]